MDFKEALKQATETKTRDSFLLIQVAYDTSFVLPYKDGVTFLQSLQKAEIFKRQWSSTPDRVIVPMSEDDIRVTPMSFEAYTHIKMAKLLNVNVEDIQRMAEQEEEIHV